MLERLWRKGNALILLVGMQIDIALWKMIWSFLIKLNVSIPYDLEITLGIYPKELKTYVRTEKLHTDVYK